MQAAPSVGARRYGVRVITVDDLLASCDTALEAYADTCRALGDDLLNARLDDVPGSNTASGLVAHVVGVMARWGRTVNRGIIHVVEELTQHLGQLEVTRDVLLARRHSAAG